MRSLVPDQDQPHTRRCLQACHLDPTVDVLERRAVGHAVNDEDRITALEIHRDDVAEPSLSGCPHLLLHKIFHDE